jgi:uncharacterized protein (TIRG00374 family)
MKIIRNIFFILTIVLILLYSNILDYKLIISTFHSRNAIYIFKILLILLLVNTLSGLRWIFINRIYGVKFNVIEGLNISYKSGLFIYLLPGQIGSEISKIFLSRNTNNSYSTISLILATSVDRILALFSQLILAFLILIFVFKSKLIHMYSEYLLLSMFFVIIISFLSSYFLVKNFIFKFKYIEKIDFFGNILKSLKIFFIERALLALGLTLVSVLMNLLVCYSIFDIGLFMFNSLNIRYIDITLMTVLSNLSTVIPISPGGIGVSEYVFSEIGSKVIGNAPSSIASVYMMFRILNLFSYILATIFFIMFFKNKSNKLSSLFDW